MSIASLSMRSLSALMSFVIVVMFLCAYFSFKYLWSYDNAITQVESIHKRELKQVDTMLELAKNDLEGTLSDYAAWDRMGEFARIGNQDFLEDDLNIYTLDSMGLTAVFIFNTQQELMYGARYDHNEQREVPVGSVLPSYFKKLLKLAEDTPVEQLEAVTGLLSFEDHAYIYSLSRICNSDEQECNSGFSIFIKSLEPGYLQLVEQTTGLNVSIHILKSIEVVQRKSESVAISDLHFFDPISGLNINVKVTHSITPPSFFESDELIALMIFTMTLFVINSFLVHKLTQPINQARKAFIDFSQQGKPIPESQKLVSKEMNQFFHTINQLLKEIDEQRNELKWQSEHDFLTGLANKRLLERCTEEWIENPKLVYFSLFMIDIDYFKLYNDNYGHLAGDQTLARVAQSIDKDIHVEHKLLARFGGEEFCLVLASSIPFDSNTVEKQLHRNIASEDIVHEYSKVGEALTISIGGIYCSSGSNESYSSMVHKADQELYKAKENGRNCTYLIEGS